MSHAHRQEVTSAVTRKGDKPWGFGMLWSTHDQSSSLNGLDDQLAGYPAVLQHSPLAQRSSDVQKQKSLY